MATSAGVITVEVRGKDVNLTKLLKDIERQSEQTERKTAQVGAAHERAAQKALTHARALATLQAKNGDTAGAIQTLTRALDGMDTSATGTVRGLTQLSNLQARLADESKGLFSRISSGSASVLEFAGALGIATTAMEAATAVAARVRAGFALNAALDQDRRSIGVFLEDVNKGNKVFDEAIAFGQKYGFTQRDMGEAASYAASLIAQSTVSTQKQLEVLARLASLNPAEGIKGATFSLKELASGDITSLAERFNVSRKAARAMKDEVAQGNDVFLVMDKYLNSVGVTTDALSQRMLGAAGATNQYALAQERLTVALGKLAEKPGTAILNYFADIANNAASVLSFGDNLEKAAQKAFENADGFVKYREQITLINQALADHGFSQRVTALSQAQYDFAQSLVQSGMATDAAIAKSRALGAEMDLLWTAQQRNLGVTPALAQQVLVLSAANDVNAATLKSATQMLIDHHLSEEQYLQVVEQVKQATDAKTKADEAAKQATDAATQSTTNVTSALIEQISQTQTSTLETNKLNSVQATLASLGPAVANGIIKDSDAALILAERYGIAKEEGIKLLQIQAQLAKQQFELKSAQIAVDASVARTGTGLGDEVQRDRQEQRRLQVEKVNQAYAEAQRAQREYDLALGSTDKKLAIYQSDLDAATKKYGANSAAAIKARQVLDEFRRSLETSSKSTSRGGVGGGGSAKLSEQAKLNSTLASNEQQFYNQAEEAAITHGQNLQKIEQDYQDKVTEIQRKAQEKRTQQADTNEIDKRRSELNFLESATSSSLNKNGRGELDRIKQQYYAEFQQAQEAAQRGEVEKSQRMLKDAEDRAQTELRFAERIADLREKAENEHDKKAKQSILDQIALQETLRKKALDIVDVQSQQTAASPDAITAEEQKNIQDAANERQKALTDETRRNTEALDKLTRTLNNKNDLATSKAPAGGKDGSIVSASDITPAPAPSSAPVASSSLSAPPAISMGDVMQVADARVVEVLAQLAAKVDAMKDAIVQAETTSASKVVSAVGAIKLTATKMG